MSDANMDFLEKINALKKKYQSQLPEKLEQIDIINKEFCDDSINFEKWEEFYQIIHKISGSSAIFGFEQISQHASELEMKLKAIIKNEITFDDEQFNIVLNHVNQLRDDIIAGISME